MIYDLPGEIWKDIQGYEDSYSVSNMGRVKSKDRYNSIGRRLKGRIRKQVKMNRENTLCFWLGLNCDGKQKNYQTARLVVEAFIGKINEDQVVIHIDGDNYNNKIDNLKIASRSDVAFCSYNVENGEHIKSLLSNNIRKPIVQLDLDDNVIAEFDSSIEIKNRFGFNQSNISNVCTGKRKAAYGFKWRYKDDT